MRYVCDKIGAHRFKPPDVRYFVKYQDRTEGLALGVTKSHGVDTEPALIVELDFLRIAGIGKIKSQHLFQYSVDFRVSGNFQHRHAKNFSSLRHMKDYFGLRVPHHNSTLWIEHQNPFDHATQY